jgi:type VI secretion system protein
MATGIRLEPMRPTCGVSMERRRDVGAVSAMAGWSLPILAAVSLASCRTPETLCVAPSGLNRLTITTEPGTNGGLATEMDLVFVTSKKAYEAIGEMKARDYFAQREQIVRDFPTGLRIRSFGLEQTQRQVAYKTEPPCNLVGTFLFVNYNNDKPNRIRLKEEKAGTLALEPDDFAWRPK